MFTVKKATSADAELIEQLARRVFYPTYKDILSPEQADYMFDWMYAPANTRKAMSEGHQYFILAADGQDCGYLSIEPHGDRLFHIQKIYILPEYQGTGAGRFLFNAAIDYCKTTAGTPVTIELNVNRFNPAVNFYKKMGMTVARQGDFPIGNGYFMEDYIMQLRIEN
jgi:GNAT superfamily N-acetyltransferase